jgi:hypothetical protein
MNFRSQCIAVTLSFFGMGAVGWYWGKRVISHEIATTSISSSDAVAAGNGGSSALMATPLHASASALQARCVALATQVTPQAEIERHLLVLRWAEVDAPACVAWLVQQKLLPELEAVFCAWTQRDPAASWAGIIALPKEMRETTYCLEYLSKYLSEKDPLLFLSLGPVPDYCSRHERATEHALKLVAQRDPARALGLIQGSPKRYSVLQLAEGMAQTQPELASAWANDPTMIPTEDKLDFQVRLTSSWAKRDVAGAMAYLKSQPQLLHGSFGYNEDPRASIAVALGAQSPGRAMEWLTQNLSVAEIKQLDYAHHVGIPEDPAQWLPALTAGVPDEAARLELMRQFIPRCIRGTSADEVLALADVEPTPVSKLVLSAKVRGFVEDHSQEEIYAALTSAKGELKYDLALTWARYSKEPMVDDVIPVLMAHPERLDGQVMETIYEMQPDTAKRLLPYMENGSAWIETTKTMAQADPAATVKWIENLPEEKRSKAMPGLIHGWCATDEYAASAYTASLPLGAQRTAAAQSLADALSATEPADAWAWMMSVPPHEQQAERITTMARSWQEMDPSAANAAIQAAPISPELRATLLQPSPVTVP